VETNAEEGSIMKTYTYGRTPNTVIKDALPHKYPMELNKMDMMRFLKILTFVSFHFPNPVGSWASEMRTSILGTIDIEEV
jgi:hypothetical protein